METSPSGLRNQRGCGRRLDDSRDPDILQAALELLAEHGYDRLTMEAIAAKAHAGKATLYRRWPGKAELIAEAVACFHEDADRHIDTGTLRGDLRAAFLNAFTDVSEFQIRLMSGLLTSLRHNPDLAKVFETQFIDRKMGLIRDIFARGRERGEVSEGHDLDLLATVGPALIFQRLLLSSKPLTRRYVTRLIDEVMLPLAGAPVSRKASS